MEQQDDKPMDETKPEVAEKPVAEGEEVKDTPEIPPEDAPKGRPISDLVNQEFASIIKDMGFTKAVAEKSLLYTNNASVEGAMDWIQQHQDDPDFLEEEFIAEESTRDPNKPQLSKEERMQKAKELQDRLRKKREEEDKKLEEQREKDRIRSTKELQIAKRKMEESQMSLKLEMEKREKLEFIKEKKRMEEILKREKAERAGKTYVPGEEVVVRPKPSIEQVKEGIKIVNTLYTEERSPGVAKTLFKTFHTFCKNVVKNPKEDKFRSINLGNEKVQQRIAKKSGGLKMLKGVGFNEDDEGNLYLADDDLDLDLIEKAMELVALKF